MLAHRSLLLRSALSVAVLLAAPAARGAAPPLEITVAAYPAARPVLEKIVPEFQKAWKAQSGQDVAVKQSYGPSVAQARAIGKGTEVDVLVTDAPAFVTPLVHAGVVRRDWAKRLPNGASPAAVVVAVIVRKGNPKKIARWEDVTAPGVEILSADLKPSGTVRCGVTAGYGAILQAKDTDAGEAWVEAFVRAARPPPADAQEPAEAFVKKGAGDVLLALEPEALALAKAAPDAVEYVVPSPNLRVELPVLVVEKVVERRGTRAVAEAFARFLFGPRAQALYAEAGYRPVDAEARKVAEKTVREVPQLFSIEELGGWGEVEAALFADGALYDQLKAGPRPPPRPMLPVRRPRPEKPAAPAPKDAQRASDAKGAPAAPKGTSAPDTR